MRLEVAQEATGSLGLFVMKLSVMLSTTTLSIGDAGCSLAIFDTGAGTTYWPNAVGAVKLLACLGHGLHC